MGILSKGIAGKPSARYTIVAMMSDKSKAEWLANPDNARNLERGRVVFKEVR